jgi:hypothetical protein
MARPSVRALTEWRTFPGTIATKPGLMIHAVDGHFELALDHLVYLFLMMEVLVNGRATGEVVVGECHD